MSLTPKSGYSAAPAYFGALDGFRGLLAVFVAIFHTFWYTHINDTAFFNNGPVIIDLFFVFSGFLMYRLYHNKLSSAEQAGAFLKRRFARLYPIHIVMLLVFLAFAIARIAAHNIGLSVHEPGEILPFQAGAAEGFHSLLSHVTMTHSMGVHDSLSFNAPSWTISVELFAYFVFVLMFLRCPPTKAQHFGAISLGVVLIYWGLSRVKPNMDITYDYGFFRCLAGFYTGVIASWVYGRLLPKMNKKIKNNISLSMTCVELLTLSAFVVFVIYMPGKLQFFVAPFAFVFVLVFSFDGGLVSQFMSRSLFRYLAKISYSVYMIHAIFAAVFFIFGERLMPVIMTPGSWAGDVYLIVYLAVVLGASHLTWRYIECPGQKLVMKTNFSALFTRLPKAV